MSSKQDFEAQAAERRSGFFSEFIDYLKNNKKWWLTPIILVFLLVGVLVLLVCTGAAPFIFTML